MSDTAKGAQRVPKAVIEHVIEPVESKTHTSSAEAGSQASATGADGATRPETFHEVTFGFFRELGRRMWEHADAHPHATLYGIMGFVLAVLILVIGLWDTIVIAVFVGVGVVIGQMRDGDNAAVNFIRRLFDK